MKTQYTIEDLGLFKEDLGLFQEDLGLLKEDLGLCKEDLGLFREDLGLFKEDFCLVKEDLGLFKEYTSQSVRVITTVYLKQSDFLAYYTYTMNNILIYCRTHFFCVL